MSAAATKPQSETRSSEEAATERPWLWNVVLLNDDDHTYEYVIQMMQVLFAMPLPKAFHVAKAVDTQGRAICLTTHKEHAELKRDQMLAFGADSLVAGCAGSMSAIIEPAEGGGGDDDAGEGGPEG